MKLNVILKSVAAAVLLGGSGTLLAQTAPAGCPLGNQPGYGRSLSPEQRAEHRQAMQAQLATLRQKRAEGTLTAEEQTWLAQIEQRGGPCVTGNPRGAGQGKGAGNGHRRGLRDGTGPRNAAGTCPNGHAPRPDAGQ